MSVLVIILLSLDAWFLWFVLLVQSALKDWFALYLLPIQVIQVLHLGPQFGCHTAKPDAVSFVQKKWEDILKMLWDKKSF